MQRSFGRYKLEVWPDALHSFPLGSHVFDLLKDDGAAAGGTRELGTGGMNFFESSMVSKQRKRLLLP